MIIFIILAIICGVKARWDTGCNWYCYNYKECSQISVIVPPNRVIGCWGSFGCESATTILLGDFGGPSGCDSSQHSGGDYVICGGARGCANVLHMGYTSGKGEAYCEGTESCIDSNISMNIIHCMGLYSCSNAILNDPVSITATGAYSLYNASIFSRNTNSSFTLTGHMAGYGASIFCDHGVICSVYCGGTGCHHLTMHGAGQWNISYASNASYRPFQHPEIQQIQLQTNQNNKACTTVFDSMIEKVGTILDDTPGSLCCRGYTSCISGFGFETIITMKKSSNNSLVCSGQQSCQEIMINASNSDIICSGSSSCSQAKIISSANMYCSGYSGCKDIHITTNASIYCTGEESCSGAIMSIHSANNISILMEGKSSGNTASIYCGVESFCNLHCLGVAACSSISTLECSGHCEVHCNMDSGCPQWITYSPTVSTYNPTVNPTLSTYNPTVSTYYPTTSFIPVSTTPTTKYCEKMRLEITIISLYNCSLNELIIQNETKFTSNIRNIIYQRVFVNSDKYDHLYLKLVNINQTSLTSITMIYNVTNCNQGYELLNYFNSTDFNNTLTVKTKITYDCNNLQIARLSSELYRSFLPKPIIFDELTLNNPVSIILFATIFLLAILIVMGIVNNKKFYFALNDNFNARRMILYFLAVFGNFININTMYCYLYYFTLYDSSR
eukprot:70214_1